MRIFVLLCCTFFLFACNQPTMSKKERELAEREQELKEKEAALLRTEKEDIEKEKQALAEEKEKLLQEKEKRVTVTTAEVSPEPIQRQVKAVSAQGAPDVFMRDYLRYLDRQQFSLAYEKCAVTNLKAFKTYNSYASTSGYGGITNVEVKKIQTMEENPSSAKVYVSYYAEDPYNKNGDYEQYYHLTDFGGEWKITKIETIKYNQY